MRDLVVMDITITKVYPVGVFIIKTINVPDLIFTPGTLIELPLGCIG